MNLKKIPLYLFYLAALIWFFGIGGRDLYMGFLLLFIISSFLLKQNIYNLLTASMVAACSKKKLLLILGVTSAIALATFILRYYSFSWNVFDVGIHSDILYHITKGKYFSSYLNEHGLGDHFTISFSLLSLPYFLYPHVNWLVLSKLLAYLSCPLIAWQISKHYFHNQSKSLLGLYFGLAWLLLYSPSVKGLYFSFQASSLAVPFILGAFWFYLKKNYLLFGILMLFLLGFKEHLGAVWIGFGLYIFINDKKNRPLGLFLVFAGVLSVYVIIFQIMPYFRDYRPSWNHHIAIFENIPLKLLYLCKLFTPLFFLPVIFWRKGIIAAPAIGVNLISESKNMVSANYHYDDVSSVLLLISVIMIVCSNQKLFLYGNTRKGKTIITVGIFLILLLLPPAPARYLYEAMPNKNQLAMHKEIEALSKMEADSTVMYVQSNLGSHFYRKNMHMISQDNEGSCKIENHVGKTLVIFTSYNSFRMDLAKGDCFSGIEKSEKWRRLESSENLHVFERIGFEEPKL